MSKIKTWHIETDNSKSISDDLSIDFAKSSKSNISDSLPDIEISVSSKYKDAVSVVYNSKKMKERKENLRHNRQFSTVKTG